MALYRTGTASMDAQGVITGVGTKWREPLSLIRTGATIVFLTTPLTLAVISDIVSDTEMKAIQTNGAVVPDGNYVILLNDSLTVDGMAQDVAETLRYYQSKETEIADALEFFRDFDLQGLKDLVARIEQAAKDTDQAKLDAQAAQAGAEAAQQATNQIKQETQSIKDSAVTELTQIKDQAVTDVTAIKDQAVSETTSIKNEALDARDAAEEAQFAAEESKSGADTAKAGAETARDQAEQWAKSVNLENLLHKDQNLADVIDKALARSNLDVPAKSETFLIENNFSEIADRAAAWLNMRPIGATPLGGDPVNDYDATTKRWVENYVSGGGGVGPTMNGVQNFGIGERTLWDSRAFIPAWAVPADGQLLNRTDWPELWAHAQMHTPIDDADWLADQTKRCNYSNGDGATTFRVPDMNGVQDGSLWGLYGRGDAGGRYIAGSVLENGAPDIVGVIGQIGSVPNLNYPLPIVTTQGAFKQPSGRGNPRSIGTATSAQQATTLGSETVEFKASFSNAAYGRASEVRPNSFVGVWIIRASGGFTAANTSWSVINGDENTPPVGDVTNGGFVRSSYKIGGVEVARGSMYVTQSLFSSGFRDCNVMIEAWSTDTSASWSFNHGGFITPDTPTGQFITQAEIGRSGGLLANGDRFIAVTLRDQNPANADAVGKTWIMSLNGTSGLQFIARNRAQSNVGQLVIKMPYSSGTLALQGTSGLEYKRDIKEADLSEAVNRIDALRMVNFVYKDDEKNRERFGIIAEEAELVAPQYIKHNRETVADIMDEYGNKIGEETRDRPSIDNNPIVMDLLGYVKDLKLQVYELKKEIAELKANK